MARLFGILSAVLATVTVFSVSATTVKYNVTRAACTVGSTCPTGNSIGQVYFLNGVQAPNLTLNIDDTVQFTLAAASTAHPFTTCQNSNPPVFCQGATASNQLSAPIINAGDTATVTFSTVGTYYYGCLNHVAMGATITVQPVGDL